jgi:hypothetical protein
MKLRGTDEEKPRAEELTTASSSSSTTTKFGLYGLSESMESMQNQQQ